MLLYMSEADEPAELSVEAPHAFRTFSAAQPCRLSLVSSTSWFRRGWSRVAAR